MLLIPHVIMYLPKNQHYFKTIQILQVIIHCYTNYFHSPLSFVNI